MANQSKLKAWVRYDGTNTVVTAGPIFRASKPKVGNWRQINADLCCNPSSSSTTTTTTTSQGSTSTAWSFQVYPSSTDACAQNTGYGPYTVYTAGSTLTAGVTLWSDAALTIPYSPYPGRPWLAQSGTPSNVYYGEIVGSNTTITGVEPC